MISSILIVGGGTAGWLSALYLNREFPEAQVALVESPRLPTIGVGESTTPNLVQMLFGLGLDETSLLIEADATFKHSGRFSGWEIGGNEHYLHFFTGIGIDGIQTTVDAWAESQMRFHDVLAPTQAAMHASYSAVRPLGHGIPWDSLIGPYALHFDAVQLGRHLAKVAQRRGVTYILAGVEGLVQDHTGKILGLRLDGDVEASADLYIDCTGFRRVLISKMPNVTFERWKMPCTAAVAMRSPHDESSVHPWTESKTMPAGWRWSIPLQSKRGEGYVYNPNHISADEAEAALVAEAGAEGSGIHLSWTPGRVSRQWSRNCVAIGLAAGFPEPMEATGLAAVAYSLKQIRRSAEEQAQERFNARVNEYLDDSRDFLLLHYLTCQRQEAFWREWSFDQTDIPDSLMSKVEQYHERRLDESGANSESRLFTSYSYASALAGVGIKPSAPRRTTDDQIRQFWNLWAAQKVRISRLRERLPTHLEHLRNLGAHISCKSEESSCLCTP